MCISLKKYDTLLIRESIKVFKVVHIENGKFYSQMLPSSRHPQHEGRPVLGTRRRYPIGKVITDNRGIGFYVYQWLSGARLVVSSTQEQTAKYYCILACEIPADSPVIEGYNKYGDVLLTRTLRIIGVII